MSVIVLTISTLNFKAAHEAGFRSTLRVRGEIGIDCHSMIWLFVTHTQILSGGQSAEETDRGTLKNLGA